MRGHGASRREVPTRPTFVRGGPVACFALLLASGCGGAAQNPASAKSADSGAESDPGIFAEAPHAPLPQLVYQEGPLVASPEIVTVTFPGDPNADALEAFDDSITSSTWWTAVTAGFCNETGSCIGSGSPGGHVRLTTPPAASYTDSTIGGDTTIQAFLSEEIAAGSFPPIDPNTLYVLYVPSSTPITVTTSSGSLTSCTGFHGYHSASYVTPEDTFVPYIVVPECAPADGSNLTQSQALTFAASHEIIEATSDPDQTAHRLGYYLNLSDETVLGWNFLAGGEAADLCVDTTGLNQDETIADGYTVQRSWSNTNAAKGLDPCIPTPQGDVYFNVAPDGSSSFIVLNIGGNTTFEATAFSTTATEAWTLEGIDAESAEYGLQSPLLSFAFNGQKTATVKNGDKVQIRVTLDADPEPYGGAEGILLSVAGSLKAPTGAHPWPIFVVTASEVDGGG